MRGWLKAVCALVLFLVLVAALATLLARRPGPEQKYSVGPALPPGPVQPQLACTYIGDAVMLAPDGSLWFWGGRFSSLRYLAGVTALSAVPVPLNEGHDWRQVAAAFGGLAAVKADGTLWSWTNTSPRKTSPVQMGTDTNWTQLSGNVSHFMALKRDGTLWGWGQNESGQVGGASNSASTRITTPVQVGADNDWTAIAAGAFNSYALKRNGTLWEWGSHLTGGPVTTNIQVPTQFDSGTNWTAISAGDYHVVALKSDGTIWLAGQNAANMLRWPTRQSQPTAASALAPVGSDSDWTEVVSGQNCFYARKRDGSWWFLGEFFGQTPASFLHSKGTPPDKIPFQLDPWAFATGGATTLLLSRDGNLWTWGARAGSTIPVSMDKKIANFFASVRTFLRGGRTQPALARLSQGAGLNSETIFDDQPHKLWTIPAPMRDSLAKMAVTHTNSPSRP